MRSHYHLTGHCELWTTFGYKESFMFYHAECEYAIRNKKINVRLVRYSDKYYLQKLCKEEDFRLAHSISW